MADDTLMAAISRTHNKEVLERVTHSLGDTETVAWVFILTWGMCCAWE